MKDRMAGQIWRVSNFREVAVAADKSTVAEGSEGPAAAVAAKGSGAAILAAMLVDLGYGCSWLVEWRDH
jgi:hypothetical protein